MEFEEWALVAAVVFSGEAKRRRYFALNWIRAAATWTAFALLLAALVTSL
jgi:hypothetical protein